MSIVHSVFNSAKKPFVDIKIISVSVNRVKEEIEVLAHKLCS